MSLPMDFPEPTLGDGTASKRVLVAYASAAGSTSGVAQLIGQTLANGIAVDVRRVQSVSTLEGYSAVVLGSAVHGGKWLPEAVTFLQTHQARLSQVPTALFLVGLMVNRKTESDQKLVDQVLAPARALVKPVAEGKFVGALFTKGRPWLEGVGMRGFIAYCGLGFRGGDFRDPAAIRAWTQRVGPQLVG